MIHAFPDEYGEKLSLLADDYVLFMSHRIHSDAAAFQACYRKPVKYFGFLGPKQRTEKILSELLRIDAASLDQIRHRIYAPIGLNLGSETAEEVALSIVAELLAVKNNRSPKFLRERNGSIHDRIESKRVPVAFVCGI
ncbi:hypothetical protein skT53_12380 [Effusibacillus dendaii]|uniref:XdhC Rossmann domain-containing protein n=1 Tax=Effusibacillus dendaii TaxID=2743772 RepID=A0A7I8D7W6_9BACL|nr:hypothetical protein skT53_12380 [Effusibacillus dendaii]